MPDTMLSRSDVRRADNTHSVDALREDRPAARDAMPPIHRTPMAPEARRRRSVGPDDERDHAGLLRSVQRPDLRSLERAALRRRWTLAALVGVQTCLATDFMTTVLPYQGRQPLEIAILVLFAVLFAWVSAGFWTALAGFALLLSGKDRYAVAARADSEAPIDPGVRTAVVIPICNEDVARVFAGVRSTFESLRRTDAFEGFDFFVLSDTGDVDVRMAERLAWQALCRDVPDGARIYYRWRGVRLRRKSGNVADFCRRWGGDYRYMVVMDADSVMTGACLKRLVQLMEASPEAGIIQTIPRTAGRETLHARIQQFAAAAYGPMFAAGLHFWQLGESHYWGHNAIIRVAPFMRHCALPRMPGKGVLSGEILSHDFVEAALMRRAGWRVWIAYDLEGSYEEMPPNLLDEIKRDRRWCQGNLMNARLIAARRIHPAHRIVFVTGVMAYASALLWAISLALSTALLMVHALTEPVYFVQSYQLFPMWPEWRPERAAALFGTTLALLFTPKVLGMLIACRQGAGRFGGPLRVGMSIAGETIVSALLAPVRMLFHAQFVLAAMTGHAVQWRSPPRDDAETSWSQAWCRHGWQTLVGGAWLALVAAVDGSYLAWVFPVAGAMLLSVPLSVLSSRTSLGRSSRRAGLFLVPEEIAAPRELQETARHTRVAVRFPDLMHAVIDPEACRLARSVAPRCGASGAVAVHRSDLVDRALVHGLHVLSMREMLALADDADALAKLHELVRQSDAAHVSWRAAAAESAQPNARARMNSAPGESGIEMWVGTART